MSTSYHVVFYVDCVAKLTAEKLWNKNAQQSNRGELILESRLRIDRLILNQSYPLGRAK
jgi:hypothetical protein